MCFSNRGKPYSANDGDLKILCDGQVWQENGSVDVPCHKGRTNTEPLIGFQIAEELDLMLVANSVQLNETATSKLVGGYADLLKGIGKMKGVQVDLQVDPEVLPMEQPHRRIPFSVKPKLVVELEKLMADDIIGKVDRPTSWVSPVVITLKLSVKEVRLNVYMREAN